MNIAILSRKKIDDKLFWSGTIQKIYRELEKKKIKIFKIENLSNKLRNYNVFKREILKKTLNVKYDENYNVAVAKNYAKQINVKLSKIKKLDCILSFDFSLVSHLNTSIPIYIWSDVLYTTYYRHYYGSLNISKNTSQDIKYLEKKAVNNAKKIFLSSEWAINIAKKKYQINSYKFKKLNFGPNIDILKIKQDIKKKILKKLNNKLNLLIIAVDWKRKGLTQAYKLKKIIEKKNIKVSLTIIGAKNIKKIKDENVIFKGFINKTNKIDEKKLIKIISSSNFNLLFSKAEAYGIVLVESISLGTPNVTYDVGGISEIVKNKKSGLIYNKKVKLNKIADDIIKIYNDKKKYKKLCYKSLDYFKKKFDYNNIISKLLDEIK